MTGCSRFSIAILQLAVTLHACTGIAQASHPCELVWEGDDRPQPLLPGSRRDSPAGGGSGGGDAPRTPGADSNGFATAGSDAGSDAPETPPSRGSLTASDRAHTGERRASRLRREHNG